MKRFVINLALGLLALPQASVYADEHRAWGHGDGDGQGRRRQQSMSPAPAPSQMPAQSPVQSPVQIQAPNVVPPNANILSNQAPRQNQEFRQNQEIRQNNGFGERREFGERRGFGQNGGDVQPPENRQIPNVIQSPNIIQAPNVIQNPAITQGPSDGFRPGAVPPRAGETNDYRGQESRGRESRGQEGRRQEYRGDGYRDRDERYMGRDNRTYRPPYQAVQPNTRWYGGSHYGYNYGPNYGSSNGSNYSYYGAYQNRRWRGDIVRFNEYDRDYWRSGHWEQSAYNGIYGWWWVLGISRYAYAEPVFPYPDPFIPPTVSVSSTTPYWYYCAEPAGYYPYVATCATYWQQVPMSPVPY